MAAVVGEEKTVTQQADKTSRSTWYFTGRHDGQRMRADRQREKWHVPDCLWNDDRLYHTDTCQPVCVDAAMTAALAAQAEAVKQQVAQAQAAAGGTGSAAGSSTAGGTGSGAG